MNNDDYMLTQSQLIILAQVVGSMDLDGFLARINLAETVAPIVDPTLYRKAGDQLQVVKDLALALKPFQNEIERQRKEASR